MADKFNQKEEYEAFKKLKREQPEFLRRIEGFWKGINTAISDSATKSEKIASANKSFLGISKAVLANTKNIHKETVDWKDLSEAIVEAQKTGNTHLTNQLKQMQRMQGVQKRYNNLVNAGANSIQKMTSSIDSSLREIPLIGDFLADAINMDDISKVLTAGFRSSFSVEGSAGQAIAGGLKDNIIQGSVEGVSSGLVESAITKRMVVSGHQAGYGFFNNFSRYSKAFWAYMTGRAVSWQMAMQFNPGPGRWAGLDNINAAAGPIKKSTAFMRLGLLGVATTVAAMAVSMTRFAFQTGMGVKQVWDMGPTLLINKKYVETMAEEFGTINDVNFKTGWQLRKQSFYYGIQSDQAVKILRIQTAISDQTSSQLIDIQTMVADAARLKGVLPAKVFEDIAQNMEFFAKYAVDG